MLNDYIEEKYPKYKNLSESDKISFFNSIKENDYECFRNYIGKLIFERSDFEDWEYNCFYEFFSHPKYEYFAIKCAQWISSEKNNFYLADKKFNSSSTLYELDLETFNFQKKHCPHLINYRPFYFEELYSSVVEINKEFKVVDGSISSFQKILTDLMMEFTIKYKNLVKKPSWLKTQKEKDFFIDINFIKFRDNFMYQYIADSNNDISKYFKLNSFILIDKGCDISLPSDKPFWNIFISSLKDTKTISINNFWNDIEKKNVLEEIPEDFIKFFSDVIYSCCIKIKNKLDELAELAYNNKFETMSKLRSHRPIQVVFLESALDDIKEINKFEKKLDEENKKYEKLSSIKVLNNKYNLVIFNDVFCKNLTKVDIFKINIAKYLLENKPELFIPFNLLKNQ